MLNWKLFEILRTACIVSAVFIAEALSAQEQNPVAIFLPKDSSIFDSLSRGGRITGPAYGLSGLTRLTVPGSDTTYYVIDERNALDRWVFDSMADLVSHDSDISIIRRYTLGGEIAHLRFSGSQPDVRYFDFVPRLRMQTSQFFEAGGFQQDKGTIEFEEYQFEARTCRRLYRSIEEMKDSIQIAFGKVGTRPASRRRQAIVVDSVGYTLTMRVGGSSISIELTENDSQLFPSVNAVFSAIADCASDQQGVAQTFAITP